eukprot:TRINITY_DN2761_c0_g2_i1.p1 TRINITY_DN2761_c0_g2~~TRINITY_DN2761_c0_g2_i1.p1  ORF type:complete len:1066 (+),score=276.79 TRINITY_DN2761_c0_g2_i1:68-3199(+)
MYIVLTNESFDMIFLLLYIVSSIITQCVECNLKQLIVCSVIICLITLATKIICLPFNYGIKCSFFELVWLYFTIFLCQTFAFSVNKYRNVVIQHLSQLANQLENIDQISYNLCTKFIPKNVLEAFDIESIKNFIGNYHDYTWLSKCCGMVNFDSVEKKKRRDSVFLLQKCDKRAKVHQFPQKIKVYKNVPVLCCLLPSFAESFQMFDEADFLNFFREFLMFFDSVVESHNMQKIRICDNVIIVTPLLKELVELDLTFSSDCFSDTGVLDYERVEAFEDKSTLFTEANDFSIDFQNSLNFSEMESFITVKDEFFESNENLGSFSDYEYLDDSAQFEVVDSLDVEIDHQQSSLDIQTQNQIKTLVKLGMILNDVSKLCGVLVENEFDVSMGIAVGYFCVTLLGHENHKLYSWGNGMDEAIRLAKISSFAKLSFDHKICIQASLLYCIKEKFHCTLLNIDENIYLNVHHMKMQKKHSTMNPQSNFDVSLKDVFSAFPFKSSRFHLWKQNDYPLFTSFESPLKQLREKSTLFLRSIYKKSYNGAIFLRMIFLILTFKICLDFSTFSKFSKFDQGNLLISVIFNTCILLSGPLLMNLLNNPKNNVSIAKFFLIAITFHTIQCVAVAYTISNVPNILHFGKFFISNDFFLMLHHQLLWLVMANVMTLISFVTEVGFKETMLIIAVGHVFMLFIGISKNNFALITITICNVSQFLRYFFFSEIWIDLAFSIKVCFQNVLHRVETLNLFIPQYVSDALLENSGNSLLWDHSDVVIGVIKLDFSLINKKYQISLRCHTKNNKRKCYLKSESEKAKIDVEISKIDFYSTILKHMEIIVEKYSEIKLIDWCDDQILLVGGLVPSNVSKIKGYENFIDNSIIFNRCSQLLNCIFEIHSMIKTFNEKSNKFCVKVNSCVNYGDAVSGVFGDDRINFYCYSSIIYEAINIIKNQKLNEFVITEELNDFFTTKEFVLKYSKSYSFLKKKILKLSSLNNDEYKNYIKIIKSLKIGGSVFGLQRPKFIDHSHRQLFYFLQIDAHHYWVKVKKKEKLVTGS